MFIRDNIKKNKSDLGITQKELVEKCSLSELSIKYYENCIRYIKMKNL